MRCSIAATVLISASCLLLAASESQAQIRRVGPGSTVEGDKLRGEGVYLQGAGWYELNSAQARSIDQQTMARIESWNESYAEAQRHRWAGYVTRKKNQSQKSYDEHLAAELKRQYRLRTAPSPDDVAKGDALNVLLLDLSNPKLTETDWRLSKTPLPAGMSIRSIVYQFAPKPGAKGSDSLSRGVIALSRLDVAEWPIVLRDSKLATDRGAYETAYAKVRQECIDGTLAIPTLVTAKSAIKTLRAKVISIVPEEGGYRKSAVGFIDRLNDATGMFDAETLDYAAEIVKDTQEHDASTVGELLAFMRKYRLLFSSAEGVPGGGDIYGQLYGAMRKQKVAMGITDSAPPGAVVDSAEALQANSLWKGVRMMGFVDPKNKTIDSASTELSIATRQGDRFQGFISWSNPRKKFRYSVEGMIKGNKLEFTETGDNKYKMTYKAEIVGKTINYEVHGIGVQGGERTGKGSFTLLQ